MNKIAAGYRFTFSSTDLRGENCHSIIKEGVDEKQAYLLSDISKFIVGGGHYFEMRDSAPEWRIKSEHQKLYDIVEKYTQVFSQEQLDNMKQDIGYIIDYINENIVGYADSNEFSMRVLKHFKVEFIPEDIMIEDVTYNFTK